MEYDIAIIGSGPAGYVAAIRAAQLGFQTVCIEKKSLGGTCLNVGCIPSKALLHSSELYAHIEKEGSLHGIEVEGLRCTFSKMMERKQKVVEGFVSGIGFLFKKNKVTHVQGEGTLKGPGVIMVEGQEIRTKHIILASGSEPVSLPFLPFDEKKVLSSTGALALPEIPKKMLIIGAGIIGVELGSVYARLGSEVTFVEFLDRVAGTLDGTMSKELTKILEKQGLKFLLSHKAEKGEVGKDVKLTVSGPDGQKELLGDALLIAIGRRPFSENLGLEKLGIEKDEKGFVKVDGDFHTNVPGIYAIGDLIDGPMLAHKASEEGVVCVERIRGMPSQVEYITVPNVAYTYPEVAGVGFTEEQLKERKQPYMVGSYPFKANSRARCTGEDEGLVKILAHEGSNRLLGIHVLGAHASELIASGVLAIKNRMTAEELGDTCHAHPTLSEAIKEAALAASKGAIHH